MAWAGVQEDKSMLLNLENSLPKSLKKAGVGSKSKRCSEQVSIFVLSYTVLVKWPTKSEILASVRTLKSNIFLTIRS